MVSVMTVLLTYCNEENHTNRLVSLTLARNRFKSFQKSLSNWNRIRRTDFEDFTILCRESNRFENQRFNLRSEGGSPVPLYSEEKLFLES
jgi:hypothetical protein